MATPSTNIPLLSYRKSEQKAKNDRQITNNSVEGWHKAFQIGID